jgi:4-amino-4-deoxy-L-arabinose transferase-like glycosyltransferase
LQKADKERMRIFGPQMPADPEAARRTTLVLVRGLLLTGVVAIFLWGYAALQFNGLRHAEAMDQAQVARNLACGEGFTTQFIRPLSLWRLMERSPSRNAMLDRHPDLMNPPAYPALLGTLFFIVEKGGLKTAHTPEPGRDKSAANGTSRPGRLLLFLFQWPTCWAVLAILWFLVIVKRAWFHRVPATTLPWHTAGIVGCFVMFGLSWVPTPSFKVGSEIGFTTFGPDCWLVYGVGLPLALLNGWLVYWIGRRLFDRRAGTVAALLFIVSETTCQFAISGLSTMLGMLWMSLAMLALVVAAEWREASRRPRASLALALAAAALIGGAFLTKYGAGWLLLPACLVCWRWWGLWRGALVALGMALVFLAVTTPWLARNHALSDNALGLARYGILERTATMPGDKLQRMLDPSNMHVTARAVLDKTAANAYAWWTDSPWIGGAALIVMAFVAAIFYRFRRPQVNQLKWFAAWGALLLFLVMCTVGVEPRPDKSLAQAGNLVVLVLPWMAVFSAAMLCVWLDALGNSDLLQRHTAIALMAVAAVFPTALRMARPQADPLPYPPYHPPLLAQMAGSLEPAEFMVSDQPWAVAWYGDRHCLWLPYSIQQLYKVNDMHRHIAALLLTPVTLNSRLLTEVLTNEWRPWSPVLGFLEFPKDFPLQSGRLFVGDHLTPISWQVFGAVNTKDLSGGINMLLLCDRKRWSDHPAP